MSSTLPVKVFFPCNKYFIIFAFQLFRKVASALPGMENTPDKKEDLIEVQLKDTPQDQNQQEGGGCAC